jgi:hypothetical protein
MKAKFCYLFLFLSLISVKSFGQKYSKTQFTVFSYYVSVDEKVKSELGKIDSQIKFKTDKKQNKVEAMLIHTLFEDLTKALSDTFGIFFLPVNSFGEKVKYSDFGYPDINISKAIRLSDTKYFIKINLYIDNELTDSKGDKLEPNAFRPRVRVNVDFYNKYGNIAIQSAEGSASTKNIITVTPNFIAGMNFTDENLVKKENTEVLKELYTKVIAEVVAGIKYKK